MLARTENWKTKGRKSKDLERVAEFNFSVTYVKDCWSKTSPQLLLLVVSWMCGKVKGQEKIGLDGLKQLLQLVE